ncbi:indolepyruvate ferredoxin oxidoreductase, partial [Xanthomonas euvesicatoria]
GKRRDASTLLDTLPSPPKRTALERPWNILITGVGGTGVVTIGALLGMAGHLEGKGATVLDQTGLAQKGGAVTTHIRIARQPADIHAVRIAAGEADLVLGCDMVVVNDYWALSKVRDGRTQVVLNTYEAMPGTFTTQPDLQFPAAEIIAGVRTALGGQEPLLLDATQLATALLGDAIASNLFVLGYAWQHGLVPLSHAALMRAIELNGAAVAMNQQAFAWGRLAAIDLPAVQRAAGLASADAPAHLHGDTPHARGPGSWEEHDLSGQSAPRALAQTDGSTLHGEVAAPAAPLDDEQLAHSLDEAIARRVAFLTDYQDAAYAQRYRSLVERVRTHELQRVPGSSALTEAVARYAFKLMAYKDEYEVARLYTRGDFQRRLQQQFEGDYTLRFHLAPPLLAKKDAHGNLIKREYGPWMFTAFKLLARLKFLRGGKFDVFGYSEERRGERRLIADYSATVDMLLERLDADNVGLAAQIASIPEHIRGYGHVKHAHLQEARAREAALLAQWRNPKALHVVQAA